nr:N-acetylmuramoyl-L-alanine amidase [Paenibacillus turpanensis]
MKYTITPRYLTGSSKRRPQTAITDVQFLVAHDTGNPGSTASANVSYFERTRNEQYSSAHIFVDDTQIIECIPFLTASPEIAYHVIYDVDTDNRRFGADANDAAGGIELCYGGSINTEEAYRKYVWVHAYACFVHGLDPATQISGHYLLDPQRRTDPRNALQTIGRTFEQFLADVQQEYEQNLIREGSEVADEKLTNYPDVPAGSWYEPYVKVVSDLGIMTGYEDGSFHPEDPVSRAELAKVVNDLVYMIRNQT